MTDLDIIGAFDSENKDTEYTLAQQETKKLPEMTHREFKTVENEVYIKELSKLYQNIEDWKNSDFPATKAKGELIIYQELARLVSDNQQYVAEFKIKDGEVSGKDLSAADIKIIKDLASALGLDITQDDNFDLDTRDFKNASEKIIKSPDGGEHLTKKGEALMKEFDKTISWFDMAIGNIKIQKVAEKVLDKKPNIKAALDNNANANDLVAKLPPKTTLNMLAEINELDFKDKTKEVENNKKFDEILAKYGAKLPKSSESTEKTSSQRAVDLAASVCRESGGEINANSTKEQVKKFLAKLDKAAPILTITKRLKQDESTQKALIKLQNALGHDVNINDPKIRAARINEILDNWDSVKGSNDLKWQLTTGKESAKRQKELLLSISKDDYESEYGKEYAEKVKNGETTKSFDEYLKEDVKMSGMERAARSMSGMLDKFLTMLAKILAKFGVEWGENYLKKKEEEKEENKKNPFIDDDLEQKITKEENKEKWKNASREQRDALDITKKSVNLDENATSISPTELATRLKDSTFKAIIEFGKNKGMRISEETFNYLWENKDDISVSGDKKSLNIKYGGFEEDEKGQTLNIAVWNDNIKSTIDSAKEKNYSVDQKLLTSLKKSGVIDKSVKLTSHEYIWENKAKGELKDGIKSLLAIKDNSSLWSGCKLDDNDFKALSKGIKDGEFDDDKTAFHTEDDSDTFWDADADMLGFGTVQVMDESGKEHDIKDKENGTVLQVDGTGYFSDNNYKNMRSFLNWLKGETGIISSTAKKSKPAPKKAEESTE